MQRGAPVADLGVKCPRAFGLVWAWKVAAGGVRVVDRRSMDLHHEEEV